MKILFISKYFYPHIGGVEKYVKELSELLAKDHQLTILTEKYSSQLLDSEDNRYSIIRIPTYQYSESTKKWPIWKWILTHLSWLNSFDIVHVHDVFYWLYPAILFIPKSKLFATFHGWEGVYPLRTSAILQKRLNRKLCSGIISDGTFIDRWYGVKSDLVTFGGVRLDRTETANLPPQTLLFVGRLDPDTGLLDCLERFSQLRQLQPYKKMRLAVIGDGPHKSKLPSSTIFLSWQSHPQAYMRAATWVYTTGYLTILEAFKNKRPVLAGYTNSVKQDYLMSHPMAAHLSFSGLPPKTLPLEAFNWANQQTWTKVVKLYLQLWSKSQS